MKPKFKVGDLVTTDFYRDEKRVKRRITKVEPTPSTASKWFASADDGGRCGTCGRPLGRPIHAVDASWFKIAKEG